MAENNSTKLTSNYSELHLYEMDTRSIVVMCILALEACIVVMINALVIFLIAQRRSLQTVTNLCLGSLAMSDMFTGLIVIPLIISCNVSTYDLGTCLAMDLGSRFLAISTILHLLVITCERYYTIVFSRSALNHSSITTTQAFLALPGLWVFALMSSLVQLFWVFDADEENNRRFTVVYDLIVLSMLVLLPLVIMAVAYTHIFCVLRKQLAKIKRSLRHISGHTLERHNWKEKKALLIYGTMILVFLTGWFNYFFFTLQEDLYNTAPSLPFWVSVLFLFFRVGTGILNPILYTFLKQDFKNARKTLNICTKEDTRNLTESGSTFNTLVTYKKASDPDTKDCFNFPSPEL